ncbi:hypothetical protein [Actinoplanes sp. NPDC026623]|uniref:hypothetical protein n=1 Tax=Actinoplanes sp. NPDC026623 TaxID=3155610 RepID=UPI0033F0932D
MSGDEHEQLAGRTSRKTAPPPTTKTREPAGQSGDRALGNQFLAKSGTPHATDFSEVTMEFDGEDLIVRGDGKEIYRFGAQSGRPVPLTDADAKAAGADQVTATYMNDKRFVGVTDFGPIPEGTYAFRPPAIERFSGTDQFWMTVDGIIGKHDSTVNGALIHTGDWGSGRVALNPQGRLRPGPPGIGDVYKRTGFFLHGGILAGSSGCIDIDGNFDTVVEFLQGFRKPVTVSVRYGNDPPVPGFLQGTSGLLAYGRSRHLHGPTLGLGAEFSSAGGRAVASAEYDLVAQWAGGAAALGARLDIPFTDKEAFIRAGLSGSLDFRIFRPLYGRISGGYSWDLTGAAPQHGPEVGGGLRLDFNRVQLEAIYNVLRPTADADRQVQQALVRIGFRF